MKKTFIAFLVFILLAPAMQVAAQTVKIASIAPEASPWGQALNRMASDWYSITNGKVRLRVFHGGIAGDEIDIVRKMRLGQLQAAALTTSGATEIVRNLIGFSFPGVINTTDELNYVLETKEKEFQEIFKDNGFELLSWSNAGWVKLFSTEAINNPNQFRGLKLAAGQLDEKIANTFRNLGMQPVDVSAPEILSSLNSGLLEAVVFAPVGVAGFQWFGIVDNMLNLNIAPFFGTLVIDNRTWNRIPQQYRKELKESARRAGLESEKNLLALEAEALDLMKKNGLSVIDITAAQEQAFRDAFTEQARLLSKDFLENDLMEIVAEALKEYRN